MDVCEASIHVEQRLFLVDVTIIIGRFQLAFSPPSPSQVGRSLQTFLLNEDIRPVLFQSPKRQGDGVKSEKAQKVKARRIFPFAVIARDCSLGTRTSSTNFKFFSGFQTKPSFRLPIPIIGIVPKMSGLPIQGQPFRSPFLSLSPSLSLLLSHFTLKHDVETICS